MDNFKRTEGGAVPVGTIPPAPEPRPHPENAAAVEKTTGQAAQLGIELLLLAPAVWQAIDRERVEAAMPGMFQALEGLNMGETLTALISGLTGTLVHECRPDEWNRAVYDVFTVLQHQMVANLATAIAREQQTGD